MLIKLLKQQIINKQGNEDNQLVISYKCAAIQISTSQLALLETWLLGKAKSTDENLASAIKNVGWDTKRLSSYRSLIEQRAMWLTVYHWFNMLRTFTY